MKKMDVIQVPIEFGCDSNGTAFAPSVLCRNLALGCLNQDFWHITEVKPTMPLVSNQMLTNCDYVLNISQQLKKIIFRALQLDHTVLTVGGDHSIAIGTIAASLQYDENIAVIYVDAHGDMNTEESSPTGNIHGMPMAALMGCCTSALDTISSVRLKPQNIFWIGVRDLDEGEKQLAEKLHLNIYSTQEILRRGMQDVMAEIHHKMDVLQIKNIHCSFDVDVIDPSIMFATGVPVKDGLMLNHIDEFIQSFSMFSEQRVIACDFVEYNPLLDEKDQCKGISQKLIREFVKIMQ